MQVAQSRMKRLQLAALVKELRKYACHINKHLPLQTLEFLYCQGLHVVSLQ